MAEKVKIAKLVLLGLTLPWDSAFFYSFFILLRQEVLYGNFITQKRDPIRVHVFSRKKPGMNECTHLDKGEVFM